MEQVGVVRQTYLPHVDGLRCIAVLSVLLFHFGVPRLDGGYVGVDVFFVISGFLITGIIVNEVTSTGSFDFRNFYSRRIRRILPALIATLAITTMGAIACLTPADLVAYGRSLAAASASLSNLLFWSESGYFDTASQTKPLLHTWSLSVEEQFYLFWPGFLYLCHRIAGRKGLIWGIVVSGLLSFAANHAVVASHKVGHESALFFLPHFRVFEFALGGIGYFINRRLTPQRWLHEVLMASGLALIAYAVITLREGLIFPYINAIAPCIGALIVILASKAQLVGRILTNRISVWIGRISYSLYLAHWPAVVFVGQLLPTTSWINKFLLMAALSLAIASALHYLVETRFRHTLTARRPVRRILVISGVLIVAGMALFASNGMTWRYRYFTPGTPLTAETLASEASKSGMDLTDDTGHAEQTAEPPFRVMSSTDIESGRGRRFSRLAQACSVAWFDDTTRCFKNRPVQVLFFGNSHEPDAFNAFSHLYAADKRVNMINFGTVNDCDMQVDAGNVSSSRQELGCAARFKLLNDDAFAATLDVIVYNTHMGFDAVSQKLWDVLELLKEKNPSLRIIAIGSYLQTSSDCSSLYNRLRTFDACRRPDFVNYLAPDERTRSPVLQVKSLDYLYISKYELFCRNGDMTTCAIYANEEPAFYDQHHLSLGFADYMGERIAEQFGQQLIDIGLPPPVVRPSSQAASRHVPGK